MNTFQFRSAILLAIILSITAAISNAQKKQIVSIKPAVKFEDAMVSGNGLSGIMQFGDPENETIVFNSHKFIYPNGAPVPIPDMSDMVDAMQYLFLKGEVFKGWKMYLTELRKRGAETGGSGYESMLWTQPFHPGYNLKIEQNKNGSITNYKRVTDYQTGEIIVSWQDDTGYWERCNFVSRDQDLIVTKLIAPDKGKLNCTLSVEPSENSPKEMSYFKNIDEQFLNIRAKYPGINGKQGGYEGVTKMVVKDGLTTVKNRAVNISGAREILLLTKLERYKDDWSRWNDKVLQAKLNTISSSYAELLAKHVAIQKEMFNRAEFSLGATSDAHKKSTEDLIKEQLSQKEGIQTALLEKLFYTSRYLFMASCGDEYGPRLTGLFIGAWGAGWSGDYTCDANVNLAVLGGNVLNLPECMNGWFSLLERTQPQWREAARNLYGCRGILGPVRIDGEVAVPHHVNDYHAHLTATGLGPWLLYPMFEHVLVTGDLTFLKERLYPLLQQQMLFYEDFLRHKDENGNYYFVPANSPENGSPTVKPRTSASINSVMDIAACKHAIDMFIEVEKMLGIKSKKAKEYRELYSKIPPYLINKEGALQEWAVLGWEENYGHRHSSHMYLVNTSYEVNPDNPKTKQLIPAVSKALDLKPQDMTEGHGTLQIALARLRLKEGEQFYLLLKHLLNKNAIFTSLATSHNSNLEVYNYDMILSLQGLLAEMLIYSEPAMLELMPALLSEFSHGEINGLKGRNRCTIESLNHRFSQAL